MRRLIDVLGSDHQTGVVAPQLRNPDGSLQPSCRRFPRRRDVTYECLGLNLLFPKSRLFNSWKMGDFDHLSQRRVEQPQGAFLLTTREVMNSVGLWDETYPMFFSDVEWCHRVKNAGLDIIFEPGARVMHQKGVSIYKRRAAMIWTSHISFYRYLKKYRAHGLGFIVNGLFGVFMVILALVRIGLSKLTTNSSKKNETR